MSRPRRRAVADRRDSVGACPGVALHRTSSTQPCTLIVCVPCTCMLADRCGRRRHCKSRPTTCRGRRAPVLGTTCTPISGRRAWPDRGCDSRSSACRCRGRSARSSHTTVPHSLPPQFVIWTLVSPSSDSQVPSAGPASAAPRQADKADGRRDKLTEFHRPNSLIQSFASMRRWPALHISVITGVG